MRANNVTKRLAPVLALALLATYTLPRLAIAAEPFQIDVILPLTGNAAFVGQGQQATLQLVEKLVNKEGGIAGRPLKMVFQDDQSSPQVTLQIANTVLPNKPPVIIGSSIVAMCNAIAPLLKAGPVDYCLSPGVHPADGSFVFSSSVSTTALMETAIRYFRLNGWTRIATLTSSDATGQDADKGLAEVLAMPENAGMIAVERQHFTQGDVSVSAQIERIKQANPQALIAWTTGAAIATIFKGVIQAGLDVPIATTNGNQTNTQMQQYADFLPKQLVIPSSLFPRHAGSFQLDPRVEAEQQKFYTAMDAAKLPIDNMAALAWDPARMVVAALRKLGPNATGPQLREALAGTTDFAGVNGVYNFTKVPQRGLDSSETVMTAWDSASKSWHAVSQPSGKPIGK
jgi:branched-chain amino acid transport system substrate-binding protein